MIEIERTEIGPRTKKLIGTWTVEIVDCFVEEILRAEDARIIRKILRTVRKAANKRKKQKRARCK